MEKAEKHFKDWGSYYPPRAWEEFEEWNTKTFLKHLRANKSDVIKTKSYVGLLDSTKEFGFYMAFQKPDYEMLNNVLYQTSRQKLLDGGMTASGADHCRLLMDATSAFACNDFEIIDCFFPKELPHSKGVFYTEVSVNLLKVLYYKENDLREEAIRKANEFLGKKISLWEKYVVSYFLSLIDRNSEEASACLLELCKAYQKLGETGPMMASKLKKCFASEIHGLYRFARIVGEDFFNKITRPDYTGFLDEFETWQKEHNYPKGKLFYRYPAEMGYMNKIFEASLPMVALKEYDEIKKIVDVEKFAADLTANVARLSDAPCGRTADQGG
ncbi:MAG: hypothetical protein FWC42_04135 [Proteobacteria bacterium]|nr:hypothetical protein [Pseudomonadota bacterium]